MKVSKRNARSKTCEQAENGKERARARERLATATKPSNESERNKRRAAERIEKRTTNGKRRKRRKNPREWRGGQGK